MNTFINGLIAVATLAAGLLLAIKPEKAIWFGTATKVHVRVVRIVGIVILVLLAAAAFAFFMAWKEGQIVF